MAYNDRIRLFNRIEEIRGRPLIAYITSSRANASGSMARDVLPELCKQIAKIPDDKREIDFLIVSNGGDPIVSWRIICMLRERFDKVSVLLPNVAYSAATLLALGADEIFMHPFSNLGPVDPQLVYYRKRQGQQPGQKEVYDQMQFGAEDLVHFIDFMRKDVGISDQEQMERAFELMCKEVGSIPIGTAKRSSHLALSMGEKLLGLHMKDQSKVKAIAEALNKSFYHHGYPVGRKEAKEIGLPIVELGNGITREVYEEIEKLIWLVWLDIENEMDCNKPFNPLEIVLNDPNNAVLLGPVTQIQMPTNLPPQMLQQVYNQIMQQIQQIQVPPMDFQQFIATLESNRCRSEYRTKGKIYAVRYPDTNIGINVIVTSQSWNYQINSVQEVQAIAPIPRQT